VAATFGSGEPQGQLAVPLARRSSIDCREFSQRSIVPTCSSASSRHTKIESTVRHLGIEVVDALAISEQPQTWAVHLLSGSCEV